MAGIYLHIPFCKKACHYCDFHFSTSLKYRERMIASLKQELFQRREEMDEAISTIYFGGGTPSILSVKEIESLLDTISRHFYLEDELEITLECNPDDTSTEKFRDWHRSGINRLSIGIQSFSDEDLSYLGRVHDAGEAEKALEEARSAGFDNFTADLIYGLPGAGDDRLRKNIDIMLAHGVPHISAYALTVEQGTYLAHAIAKGKWREMDEEQQNRQFFLLRSQLRQAGMEHYEISNYARPGFRSRHNSNYWSRVSYLGIGPSAHSYHEGMRRWNISNNGRYMKAVEEGERYWESEKLGPLETYNETVLVSLRKDEGVNIKLLAPYRDFFLARAEQFLEKAWMVREGNFFRSTEKGMIWLDRMTESLFISEEFEDV